MALVDVTVEVRDDRPPPEIRRFLRDAERRITDFTESSRSHPIPAFVPSDFLAAYYVLAAIEEHSLAAGSLFCEWGCGFGVVTCLAAWLEFEAYGIEIESELIREANALATDYGIAAEFIEGNFVPPGGEFLADNAGDLSWLATEGGNPYEECGINIDDFDVIYAYPWPGEDDILGKLFHRYAADGALLVTYNGIDDLRVRRRIRTRRR